MDTEPRPMRPFTLSPTFQTLPLVSLKLVDPPCGIIASIVLLLKKDTWVNELRLFKSPSPSCPRTLAPAAPDLFVLSIKNMELPPANILLMPTAGEGISTRCDSLQIIAQPQLRRNILAPSPYLAISFLNYDIGTAAAYLFYIANRNFYKRASWFIITLR